MPRLELCLFGSFQATVDDETLTDFYSDKVRALLSYLVLEGRHPIRRETLADLLWHGYLPKSTRASLRVALSQLRKRLSPLDLLVVTRNTVHFDLAHPEFWCDVTPDPERCPACHERLQEADSLCRGDFLEGLNDLGSPPFETWRRDKQNKYQSKVAEAG